MVSCSPDGIASRIGFGHRVCPSLHGPHDKMKDRKTSFGTFWNHDPFYA